MIKKIKFKELKLGDIFRFKKDIRNGIKCTYIKILHNRLFWCEELNDIYVDAEYDNEEEVILLMNINYYLKIGRLKMFGNFLGQRSLNIDQHYFEQCPLRHKHVSYPVSIPIKDVKDTPRIGKCRQCGYIILYIQNLIGEYCPECGYKHPSYTEYAEEQKRPICSHCNAINQYGKFCMKCGRKMRK